MRRGKPPEQKRELQRFLNNTWRGVGVLCFLLRIPTHPSLILPRDNPEKTTKAEEMNIYDEYDA